MENINIGCTLGSPMSSRVAVPMAVPAHALKRAYVPRERFVGADANQPALPVVADLPSDVSVLTSVRRT